MGPKTGPIGQKNWKIDFFTKTGFLTIQVEIGEVWGFPGWPQRAYGHTCKFSADLVLHGIENSTFRHFPENWFSGKLNSSPILFFCPRNPKSDFFLKIKKTRAGKWSKSVKLKVDLVNYDAIWCQIGSQFPWVRFFNFLLSMENQGNISFFSVFIIHGFPMDFPWISHWVSHGFSHGFCIGFSMDFPWIDFPWFVHELQNVSLVVSGTPPGVRKQSRHRHIQKRCL